MDPLFPALPEDLSVLDREALTSLEEEHLAAQQMIREDNKEFLDGFNAAQVVAEARTGKAQLALIRESLAALDAAEETYVATIEELTSEAAEQVEEPQETEPELSSDPEPETEPEVIEDPAEEPVLASAEIVMRRPAPQPTRERLAVVPDDAPRGAVLLASASGDGFRLGDEVSPSGLAKMLRNEARRLGKPNKREGGTEERYPLAAAAYQFPPERILTSDIDSNSEKIRMLRNTEGNSLIASGGLCAPLTPIYTIPQFSTNARPVRDALPSYQADRGGVNVPVPTTLASAFDAITIITADEDALGGTFATKACLDQECLGFVETAVTIISHCREYGNLNARAWPESITFENELTMAEHARVAESYLLDRIKAQSLSVTTPDAYSTVYELVSAAAKAVSGIRYRLRTGPNFRFRALFPEWIREQVVVDIAATPFDRFQTVDKFSQLMRGLGIEPSFYLDTPSTGTPQGFADEVAASEVDAFPIKVQWALFPEGAFIHVDGGMLNLGLVRDSTLNSTNDFQFFGETFENVALLAPQQAALWIESVVCPSGEFPSTTAAITCA